MATSSSAISFGGTHKPGGTLIGVTGNATGRIIDQYSDRLGRFSTVTLLGHLGKKITVISAYQMPQNSNSAGITTAHHQQVLQLKLDGTSDQHPRRQFCQALDLFLQSKIEAQHQIILGSDINKDIGLNMHGFTHIISKYNLTDIHHVNLGADNEPATYAHGTKRLDYIFMSDNIASLVVQCSAEPFNHQIFSDHQGMFVDLRLMGLFDQNLSPLSSPKV
jgi:hypothetical protein